MQFSKLVSQDIVKSPYQENQLVESVSSVALE